MRVRGWSLVLLVAARAAVAHIVPIPASTCVLDPVEIVAPATGTEAMVAPPSGQLVIRYDTQASQAQFDLTAVPPRSFVAAGVPGTLALPTFFPAALTHSGDLTAAVLIPIVFAMNGTTVAVPLTLTPGLPAAAGTLGQAAPIGPAG